MRLHLLEPPSSKLPRLFLAALSSKLSALPARFQALSLVLFLPCQLLPVWRQTWCWHLSCEVPRQLSSPGPLLQSLSPQTGVAGATAPRSPSFSLLLAVPRVPRVCGSQRQSPPRPGSQDLHAVCRTLTVPCTGSPGFPPHSRRKGSRRRKDGPEPSHRQEARPEPSMTKLQAGQ